MLRAVDDVVLAVAHLGGQMTVGQPPEGEISGALVGRTGAGGEHDDGIGDRRGDHGPGGRCRRGRRSGAFRADAMDEIAHSLKIQSSPLPHSGGIRVRSRIIFRFPMPASLDQIVAATRRRVADAKRSTDLRRLEREAEQHVPRGFRRTLASQTGPAIIAELKKASPSRGMIRSNFDQ